MAALHYERGIQEHLPLKERHNKPKTSFSLPPPTSYLVHYFHVLHPTGASSLLAFNAQTHETETLLEMGDCEDTVRRTAAATPDAPSPETSYFVKQHFFLFSSGESTECRDSYRPHLNAWPACKYTLWTSFANPLPVLPVQVEVRIKAPLIGARAKLCINVRNNLSISGETNERWCKSWVNIPEGTAWSCSEAETSWITIRIQKFLSACYECCLLKIRPRVWSSLPVSLKFVHRDIFVIQTDKMDHDSKQWSI